MYVDVRHTMCSMTSPLAKCLYLQFECILMHRLHPAFWQACETAPTLPPDAHREPSGDTVTVLI
jgi:hypothetical protein